MSKGKTYGTVFILGKPCIQKIKKLPDYIRQFVELEACYYYVKGNCISKFNKGKLVPLSSVYIVNPLIGEESLKPIVSLKELSHYFKLPAGDLRDFLTNANPLNSTQFSGIDYYYKLFEKCNDMLAEVCPDIKSKNHQPYRFQIAGSSYLDKGFILTTKIIYITLHMLSTCKLPVCIVRDIINKWNFTDKFSIVKADDSKEMDSYLTDVVDINVDLGDMEQQVVNILGQYHIGSDYTRASRTKVNTPVIANKTFRIKSSVVGGSVTNNQGTINYDNAYLVGIPTAHGSSYRSLDLIIPYSKDLLYYNKPSSALDIAKIVMELIYSLQVKACYFTMVER